MKQKASPRNKFTAHCRKLILEAIQLGSFRDVAAEYAGVRPTTLSAWMHRTEPQYRAFQKAVMQAEKSRELRALALVIKAGQHDVTHARWWLERKYPDRWGHKVLQAAREAAIAHLAGGVVVAPVPSAVTSARLGFVTLRMRIAAQSLPPAMSPDVMAERLEITPP